MKSNELRIGNYVNVLTPAPPVSIPTGQQIMVSEITWEGVSEILPTRVNNIYLTWHEIDPIPLTEEWLLRFGFNISRTQAMKKYNEWGDQVSINMINGKFELVYLAVPIQFVHQLQNLYFALTGEELQLKS